jgi:hypothetical protein
MVVVERRYLSNLNELVTWIYTQSQIRSDQEVRELREVKRDAEDGCKAGGCCRLISASCRTSPASDEREVGQVGLDNFQTFQARSSNRVRFCQPHPSLH